MEELQSQQSDEKKAKAMQECDKKEKLSEKLLAALKKGDLNGAVSAAETGLEKCMSMSETCAFQIAPAVVNSVVMRAMLEQAEQGQGEEVPITTVLVAQPVIEIEQPVMVVEDQPVMVVEEEAADALASDAKTAAKSVAKTTATTASPSKSA